VDEAACATHPGRRPGPYLRLTVADDGVGMDAETLAHVFEPFFTTKGSGHGTGLGLATVYGIATQNGGFVDVLSTPGKGTTFHVHLPRAAGGAEAAVVGEPRPAAGGAGSILLVEDDAPVRRTAFRMLESLGYAVVVAASPAEAITTCQETSTPFDLLLTDVVMPGMKGPELRARIEPLRPGIRTIYMSGHTADAVLTAGVGDENVRFLQKPFSRGDLADKVRQALA
jgi:CheY-like chemotaxis protein